MGAEETREHYIERGETFSVVDEWTSVDLRKIYTPAGERLEVEAPNVGHSVRVDAVELESLSWQEPETFLGFLDSARDGLEDVEGRRESIRRAGREGVDGGETVHEVRVTNEFAEAVVRTVETDAGERLELEAPKLGYRTRLTASALETVSWQETQTFTDFLEKPFGPGGH